MFVVRGASIPTRTEFGPIRTTVMATSSPIRIRSPVFLDKTSISFTVSFRFGHPCADRSHLCRFRPPAHSQCPATIPAETRPIRRHQPDCDINTIAAGQKSSNPNSPNKCLKMRHSSPPPALPKNCAPVASLPEWHGGACVFLSKLVSFCIGTVRLHEEKRGIGRWETPPATTPSEPAGTRAANNFCVDFCPRSLRP